VKARSFVLVTVLATMLGGTSALAQTERRPTPPELNTEVRGGDVDRQHLVRGHVHTERRRGDGVHRVPRLQLNPTRTPTAARMTATSNRNFDRRRDREPTAKASSTTASFVSAFVKHSKDPATRAWVPALRRPVRTGARTSLEEDLLISARPICAFNRGGDEEDEGDRWEAGWAGQGPPPWAGGQDPVGRSRRLRLRLRLRSTGRVDPTGPALPEDRTLEERR
jgi:hypothetical protein